MNRAVKTIGFATLMSILAIAKAKASTFYIDGKEVTKGEAVMALAKDPKIKVIKQDQVVLNAETGTLKNKAK